MNFSSPPPAIPPFAAGNADSVSGAVLLLVACGSYGAVPRSGPGSGARLATAFGTLSVVEPGDWAGLISRGSLRPSRSPHNFPDP
jgi:hypothetical protein